MTEICTQQKTAYYTVFWLPDGAEMLSTSGRDIPREQNDDCGVVFPAVDAELVTLGATGPASDGLLAIGKPHN